MELTQALTRDIAFPQNMDPTGKVWAIFKHDKHPSLFVVNCSTLNSTGEIIPRPEVNIPEQCKGEWTHPMRAQAAIEDYLNKTWAMSDEATKRSAAKTRARAEAMVPAREDTELEKFVGESVTEAIEETLEEMVAEAQEEKNA